MLKRFCAMIITMAFVFSLSQGVSSAASSDAAGTVKRKVAYIETKEDGKKVFREYMEGEVIVRFKPGLSDSAISEILSRFSARKLRTIAKGKNMLIRLKNTKAVESFLAYDKKTSRIEYAVPNFVHQFPKTRYGDFEGAGAALSSSGKGTRASAGGEPLLPEQWYTDTIRLPDAWAKTKGDSSVKVAVIDSGLDTTHPEFSGKVYACRDFSQLPYKDNRTVDGYGHGTHVSGIIAARDDNGAGISGVAPRVRLIVADVGIEDEEAEEQFTEEAVIDAIYWCTDKGARVINMSLLTTVYEENPLLKDAIAYAAGKGVVVVCASGNYAVTVPFYPADDENAVSVISVDSDRQKSDFSNFGRLKEISAPGGWNVYTERGILSTVPMDFDGKDNESGIVGYDYYEGTSMSSAVASGVFALLFSKYPGLTAAQAKDIVFSTAQDDARLPGKDIYLGWGVIDADAALDKAATLFGRVTDVAVTPDTPCIGTDASAQIAFNTDKDGYCTVRVTRDGQTVKTLWANHPVAAGAQNLAWDFTDENGDAVLALGEHRVLVEFRTALGKDGYASAPISKAFTLDAAAMHVTDGAYAPGSIVQTKGAITVSARLDQKGSLAVALYRGAEKVREIATDVVGPGPGPIFVTWDQKDDAGAYVAAGVYTVKVFGRDVYGRETAVQTLGDVDIDPDDIDPVITVQPGDAAFTGDGTAVYAREIALSEPSRVTVRIRNASGKTVRTYTADTDGNLPFEWDGRTGNGLYVPTGAYTFAVDAKDLIGNGAQTRSFAVQVTDDTSLAITGTLSAERVVIRKNTLKIAYRLSEKAKVSIKVYSPSEKRVVTLLNKALKSKGKNSVTWKLKNDADKYVPDGVYTVRIQGDNGNGKGSNRVSLRVRVSSDDTRPKVSLERPHTLRYENRGDSSASIRFRVNEKAVKAVCTIVNDRGRAVVGITKKEELKADKAYAFKWDGKDKQGVYMQSGVYYAKIYAVDKAGNVSHTRRKRIRLRDYTKPELTVSMFLVFDYYEPTRLKIPVAVSEPARVTAKVYDMFGEYLYTIVSNKRMTAGKHSLVFDGKDDKGKRIAPYLYPLRVKFSAKDESGNRSAAYTDILDVTS